MNQAVLRGIWDRALQTIPENLELQAYVNRFGTSISETLAVRNILSPAFLLFF